MLTTHKSHLPLCFAGFLCFFASVSPSFLADRNTGIYVGLGVPSILAFWCDVRLMSQAQSTLIKEA